MEVKNVKVIKDKDTYYVNFEIDKELFFHVTEMNRVGLFSGGFIQVFDIATEEKYSWKINNKIIF